MTVARANAASTLRAFTAPAAAPRSAPSRVWGLGVTDLHDRFWASRGVQVVRPGAGEVETRGPRLYLLLGADDFVIFPLKPVLTRLNWIKPRAMRLRIVDNAENAYVERVLADESDRFIAVRREYRARTRGTLRAVITGDHRLARMWRDASPGDRVWRQIVARAGRDRTSSCVCRGSILSTAGEVAEQRCLATLLRHWRNPTAGLDGVYEFDPGVLLHESASAHPGACIVGPVWAGAGARFGPGEIVVGPRIVCDAADQEVEQRPVSWETASYPGWRPAPSLRGRWFRISKRTFDICFSLAVLAMTAPIYPFVILAICLEDGWPPFFAHTRQTRRGRDFPCYKFRTMCKDADRMKTELAGSNVCDGPQFFIKDDPRLLRCGKLLRRWQLDEMPQFWNVLRGHMSVVGPRPSPDSENQFCPAWREARLSVRPGVTGLWQVRRTRAPETDFQEWIRYDLEYVQHESWRLDLWIIWRTIERVFRG